MTGEFSLTPTITVYTTCCLKGVLPTTLYSVKSLVNMSKPDVKWKAHKLTVSQLLLDFSLEVVCDQNEYVSIG